MHELNIFINLRFSDPRGAVYGLLVWGLVGQVNHPLLLGVATTGGGTKARTMNKQSVLFFHVTNTSFFSSYFLLLILYLILILLSLYYKVFGTTFV